MSSMSDDRYYRLDNVAMIIFMLYMAESIFRLVRPLGGWWSIIGYVIAALFLTLGVVLLILAAEKRSELVADVQKPHTEFHHGEG